MSPYDEQLFEQKFLEVDSEDLFSINPEISIITLSHDKTFLCAGTIQTNAKLLIWELTSRTFIRSKFFNKILGLVLHDCCMVLLLKYAEDARHIACICLTRDYTQCVYLIDSKTCKILGSFILFYKKRFCEFVVFDTLQNKRLGILTKF